MPEEKELRGRRRNIRVIRRQFLVRFAREFRVVWPIASALILIMLSLGVLIGLIEGWSLGDSFYFSFVTGLTIGYGDFVPKLFVTRVLAMFIGGCGILLTALTAAVAVKALDQSDDAPAP